MRSDIADGLNAMCAEGDWTSKGPLALALVLTRRARELGIAKVASELMTKSEGQVKGMGAAAVKKILSLHGIERTLAAEGGRTTRGNHGRARKYIALLNELDSQTQLTVDDLASIEEFWVSKVLTYFATTPFQIKLDGAVSLYSVVEQLIEQATVRQRDSRGIQYVGGMIHYLAGAKLKLTFQAAIAVRSANAADSPAATEGDYEIGNIVFHVTTSPSAALISKCSANLANDLIPIVLTLKAGVLTGVQFAKQSGIENRIEFWDIAQFVSSNLYERMLRSDERRRATLQSLVAEYNKLVEEVETDKSFKIEVKPTSSRR